MLNTKNILGNIRFILKPCSKNFFSQATCLATGGRAGALRTLSAILCITCLTFAASPCSGSVTPNEIVRPHTAPALERTPKELGGSTAVLVIAEDLPYTGTMAAHTGGIATAATVASSGLLSGLACDKTSVVGTASANCSVTISSAAASGGFVIALESGSASIVVPAKVTIPTGLRSASFTAMVSAVKTAQTVSIRASAGNVSKTLSFSLSATSPQLKTSSATLNFGGSMVGSAATTQTLTLSSAGTAPLTIQSLGLTGSEYSFSGVTLPLTLAPGTTARLNLQFTPKAVGSAVGQLAISSNSVNGSQTTVALSGNVTPFVAELNGLFCGTPTITGLGSDSCVVVLTGAAPASGLSVSINVDNPALAIPATVTVPSGQSKMSFMASRTAAGTAPSVNLTVSHGSVSRAISLALVASSPVFSLPAGSYTDVMTLSMGEATPGVTIHYTVDGSTPSASAATYTVPLTISASQTIQAVALSATSAISAPTSAAYTVKLATAAIPAGSSFIAPQPNTCQSLYDQFYGAEPGVYAFWPMCEAGTNIDIFDYVGNWGLSENYTSGQVLAWGAGNVTGGLPGPVADGETAAQVTTTASSRTDTGIPLNANQGTIALWMQAQPTPSLEQAMLFYSAGKSWIGLGTKTSATTCFVASLNDSLGKNTAATQCGFTAESWNRVVMTWNGGVISLYVNGELATTTSYSGNIDNNVFNYRLFPGCCGYTKTMTLAKALVANEAWSAQQVNADFNPKLPSPPSGGMYVTTTHLGEIHRDVLGFADDNAGLSNAAQDTAVKAGLTAAGVTAVRYANGSGGITADLENWRGGQACTSTEGLTQAALNAQTGDSIATYLPTVAQPLGLDVGFTVNYGSNPPDCNGGGNPLINGGALANQTNGIDHYGIKYWEIGNEVFSANTEPDFHSGAHTGSSYVANEPAFYDAIKAEDASTQIGVPIGGVNYTTQMNFDLPVLASAKYDAIVFHNYPIKGPVTDAATLYRDRAATNLLRTRGELLTLQTELLSHGKPGDAIWITEWDANLSGDKWTKQSMGAVMPLFAAGELAEYMRAGVKYATWWAQSAIDVCSNSNYDSSGETAYNWWECGAAGVVYNGPNPGYGHEVLVGMKPGDLMPAARAFQVLSQSGFVVEGEHMLSTFADDPSTPWLQGYAATHGDSYAVLLINRDRDTSHTVPLEFAGMSSGTSVQQWTYGRAQYDLTKAGNWSAGPAQTSFGDWSGAFKATLPPWSVSVFIFKR